MGKWGSGKIERICQFCLIKFKSRVDRPGKFCSKSCSSKANPPLTYKINVKCLECNINYIIKRYRKNTSKFCSRKCLSISRGRNMRKDKHPKWKGGVSIRTHHSRLLIKKRKNEIGKCENCGSKKNLEGHHIKGYKINNEEIKILCSTCHAIEHPRLRNFIGKKYEREVDTKN